jgi:hypothetical protein
MSRKKQANREEFEDKQRHARHAYGRASIRAEERNTERRRRSRKKYSEKMEESRDLYEGGSQDSIAGYKANIDSNIKGMWARGAKLDKAYFAMGRAIDTALMKRGASYDAGLMGRGRAHDEDYAKESKASNERMQGRGLVHDILYADEGRKSDERYEEKGSASSSRYATGVGESNKDYEQKGKASDDRFLTRGRLYDSEFDEEDEGYIDSYRAESKYAQDKHGAKRKAGREARKAENFDTHKAWFTAQKDLDSAFKIAQKQGSEELKAQIFGLAKSYKKAVDNNNNELASDVVSGLKQLVDSQSKTDAHFAVLRSKIDKRAYERIDESAKITSAERDAIEKSAKEARGYTDDEVAYARYKADKGMLKMEKGISEEFAKSIRLASIGYAQDIKKLEAELKSDRARTDEVYRKDLIETKAALQAQRQINDDRYAQLADKSQHIGKKTLQKALAEIERSSQSLKADYTAQLASQKKKYKKFASKYEADQAKGEAYTKAGRDTESRLRAKSEGLIDRGMDRFQSERNTRGLEEEQALQQGQIDENKYLQQSARNDARQAGGLLTSDTIGRSMRTSDPRGSFRGLNRGDTLNAIRSNIQSVSRLSPYSKMDLSGRSDSTLPAGGILTGEIQPEEIARDRQEMEASNAYANSARASARTRNKLSSLGREGMDFARDILKSSKYGEDNTEYADKSATFARKQAKYTHKRKKAGKLEAQRSAFIKGGGLVANAPPRPENGKDSAYYGRKLGTLKAQQEPFEMERKKNLRTGGLINSGMNLLSGVAGTAYDTYAQIKADRARNAVLDRPVEPTYGLGR